MAHAAVRRTLASRSRSARSRGVSAASSSISPSAQAARRRTSGDSSPSALPSGAIACGSSSWPSAHAAMARTFDVAIAKGVGHRADRARILELAEAEQADLAEAGVGVLGQRAELARRPRGLLARHHARGDAADAAALVAQRGAEHREHLRVQRRAGAMADVRARDAGAAAGERHRHRDRHRRGHRRRHRLVAEVAAPAPLVGERAPGQLAHRRIGGPQRGEQAVDRVRVAEVGLLDGQRGREEDCRHGHGSRKRGAIWTGRRLIRLERRWC